MLTVQKIKFLVNNKNLKMKCYLEGLTLGTWNVPDLHIFSSRFSFLYFVAGYRPTFLGGLNNVLIFVFPKTIAVAYF